MVQFKNLKSRQIALICITSFILVFNACDKGKEKITLESGTTEQTVYADDESTGEIVTFTAGSDWNAVAWDTSLYKSFATWVRLINNGEEAYQGSKGTVRLEIALDPNYSGRTRSARIEITCGSTITILVTQQATTKDGGTPEQTGDYFVLDLSDIMPEGVEIATLNAAGAYARQKIDNDYNSNIQAGVPYGIIASADVAKTGGKITFPKTLPRSITAAQRGEFEAEIPINQTISIEIVQEIVALNSANKIVGSFCYVSEGVMIVPDVFGAGSTCGYYYSSNDCEVTGIGEAREVGVNDIYLEEYWCYNLLLKKGWNLVYKYYEPSNGNRFNFHISTTKPSLNCEWRWSESSTEFPTDM